jgi:hypothetical protein
MLSSVLSLLLTLAIQPGPGPHLNWVTPDGWKPRPSASTMRVAEFVLAKAQGDPEDADVIIYFFGGGGGDVEANITRWIGQMQQPDGKKSADLAKRSSRTVNGLNITMVEVPGTYTAEMSPGATEHFNKSGFRMIAAVVQTPKGPHFIKLLGPAKTIEKWRGSFDGFLESLKYTNP